MSRGRVSRLATTTDDGATIGVPTAVREPTRNRGRTRRVTVSISPADPDAEAEAVRIAVGVRVVVGTIGVRKVRGDWRNDDGRSHEHAHSHLRDYRRGRQQ